MWSESHARDGDVEFHVSANVRRVDVRKCQTRAGLTLDGRRSAHRQRGTANQKPAGSPFIRRRTFKPGQQTRLARLAQHRRNSLHQIVAQRQPHRREHRLFTLRRLSVAHERQVVMMMMRILRRRIVIVVIVISIPDERMMRAAIRDPTMLQSHMPGGEEPAEQKEKCDETFVRAHGVMYWAVRLVLSTHRHRAERSAAEARYR